MPLDAAPVSDNLQSIDFTSLPFDKLLTDTRVPTKYREKFILFLQSSGLGKGFIKLDNYGRMSAEEDIERLRKKHDNEKGRDAFYRDRDDFVRGLEDHLRDISRELDDANHLLNLWERGKADPDQISRLKQYRNILRGHYLAVGWFAAKAAVTQSPADLDTLKAGFEKTYQFFVDNRQQFIDAFHVFCRGASSALRLTGAVAQHAGQYLTNILARVIPSP